MKVKAVIAKLAIERFNKSILYRFAGLNKVEPGAYTDWDSPAAFGIKGGVVSAEKEFASTAARGAGN